MISGRSASMMALGGLLLLAGCGRSDYPPVVTVAGESGSSGAIAAFQQQLINVQNQVDTLQHQVQALQYQVQALQQRAPQPPATTVPR
jgi:peptidoglycan hydrolase CwlO-like protein